MKESLLARVIPRFNVVSSSFRDDTKNLVCCRNKSQKIEPRTWKNHGVFIARSVRIT